jgi:undecaprenyl phosphate-alpha-L-ara4N flippase subunit ArnF
MAASILLSTLAQLSMKVSMVMVAAQTGQGVTLMHALLEPSILIWLILGLGSYAVSMVFWLAAIAHLELSLAYPMLSLSYVLVYIVAVTLPFLHEELSWTRSIGILIVLAGVILIAQSNQYLTGSDDALYIPEEDEETEHL